MAAFLMFRPARAADTGQFQLLLAAPDPALAGESVQFQFIAVNQGTEIWRAKKHYVQAEIYDDNKVYLGRTERLRSERDIKGGETELGSVSYELPVNYKGRYMYRVFLYDNDQRVIESDYTPFRVRERPVLPPKPPPMAIGGNLILSYRNATGPDQWVGNTSLNMVGRVDDKSFLFNLYTVDNRDNPLDVYSILFNYYGPLVTAGVGDVSPIFSPLSVYGQGMRGLTAEAKSTVGSVGWTSTVVAGRTARSHEGTSTTDGIFTRMLYGGKGELSLPGGISLFGNYMTSSDSEGSVSVPGPTLAPVSDKLAGGGMAWEFLPRVKLAGEYQRSSFESDKRSTAPAAMDGAWRGSLAIERDKFTFSGYVQRTGTDFVSLGAPSVTKDRFTYDGALSLTPFRWLNLYSSYDQYHDNLKNNPAKVTSQQTIMSHGATFNLPTMTSLNIGYTVNSAVGKPRTAQDNQTKTESAGVSQILWGQTFSLSYQTADFMDKTKTTNDLHTNTVGGATNLVLGSRVTSSIGFSQSQTKDKVNSSAQDSQSLSASLNIEIVKNRLSMQLWGAQSSSKNNDPINKADRQTTSGNVEFTYVLRSNLALTLGAFHNATTDKITPLNDVTGNGGNVRMSISF